jgi:hypothetical protein
MRNPTEESSTKKLTVVPLFFLFDLKPEFSGRVQKSSSGSCRCPVVQESTPHLQALFLRFHIVTCMSDSRRSVESGIAFNDHFNTKLVVPPNYSTIAHLHTSQCTRTQSLLFSLCY